MRKSAKRILTMALAVAIICGTVGALCANAVTPYKGDWASNASLVGGGMTYGFADEMQLVCTSKGAQITAKTLTGTSGVGYAVISVTVTSRHTMPLTKITILNNPVYRKPIPNTGTLDDVVFKISVGELDHTGSDYSTGTINTNY